MNTDARSAVTFFPFIGFPFLSLSLRLTQHIFSCSSTHLRAGRLERCGDQWSTLNWPYIVQNTQSRSFFQLLFTISTIENMIDTWQIHLGTVSCPKLLYAKLNVSVFVSEWLLLTVAVVAYMTLVGVSQVSNYRHRDREQTLEQGTSSAGLTHHLDTFQSNLPDTSLYKSDKVVEKWVWILYFAHHWVCMGRCLSL